MKTKVLQKSLIATLFFIFFSAVLHAQWTQLGSDIDGEEAGDYSGWSVSLSSDGHTVAIGAYKNDAAGYNNGHVRVYEWSGSTWQQKGGDIDGEMAGTWSGFAVSLSSDGHTVAIGAPYDAGNGIDAGHVRVYEWSGSAWQQKGSDIDGEEAGDSSGRSVSLSSDGHIVAIGAPFNGENGSDVGHVRVYEWSGSTWQQKGSDIDGEGPFGNSGRSVSLSSDGYTVAIGAPYNAGNGQDAGHVRVYEWSGSAWQQKGSDIDGEAILDVSGWSVSLSSDGHTVAIGAVGNAGNGNDAGHVRVYEWDGSTWEQKGSDIDGEAAGDYSGWSVSLSSDGHTVAIGAPLDGGNGSDPGYVRVYEWNGSIWQQKGSDMDGEMAEDRSGNSVSISDDGHTVAIGAPYNDGNGYKAGHVRVYTYPQSTSTIPVYMNERGSINVFPNPAEGKISVQIGSPEHMHADILVYNSVGQLVYYQDCEITVENPAIDIDTRNYTPGAYLLKLITPTGEQLKKVFLVR